MTIKRVSLWKETDDSETLKLQETMDNYIHSKLKKIFNKN